MKNKSEFEKTKNNTLKMIRNNQRYEDLIESLIYYARNTENFILAKKIDDCLKTIEKYEE